MDDYDDLSKLRTRCRLRKIARWAFRYYPPFEALIAVLHITAILIGMQAIDLINILASVGVFAYILLIIASFACGLCRLHRAFLGYDMAMTVILQQEGVPLWIFAVSGAIGAALLTDMAIRLTIKHRYR